MKVVKGGLFVDRIIRIGIGDRWIKYLLRLFDPTYQLISLGNVLFHGIELGLAQAFSGVDIVLRVLIQKPLDRLCRRGCLRLF